MLYHAKTIWAATWENQQCGFWPGLTQTRLYSHWRWLEAWNFVCRKKRYCNIQVAKTQTQISFAVTAKLICVFVFTYAKRWFSWCGSCFCMCKIKGTDQLCGNCTAQYLYFLNLVFQASTSLNGWLAQFVLDLLRNLKAEIFWEIRKHYRFRFIYSKQF